MGLVVATVPFFVGSTKSMEGGPEEMAALFLGLEGTPFFHGFKGKTPKRKTERHAILGGPNPKNTGAQMDPKDLLGRSPVSPGENTK